MKKRGQGNHCFDNDILEDLNDYSEYQRCWVCSVLGTDYHHNEHRQLANLYTDSTYNAIPLCRKCHDNTSHIDKPETKKLFFKMRCDYLAKKGYKNKEIDMQYIYLYRFEEYHKYTKNFIKSHPSKRLTNIQIKNLEGFRKFISML